MYIWWPKDQSLYPPEAVQVRNTFIHVASPLSEDVLSSRPAVSCPASQIGLLQKSLELELLKDIQEDDEPILSSKPYSKPVICLENALFEREEWPFEATFEQSFEQSYQEPYEPRFEAGFAKPGYESTAYEAAYAEGYERYEQSYGGTSCEPLSTVPTVPAPFEPAPGSAELPSVGSRGHYNGDCKPCSFLYAKGCNNGAMCLFCHLCDRSEKKRRQKAKRAALKGGA